MAPSAVLVVPGRLETRTGGYIYDRRAAEGLRRLGWTVNVRELDDSFPRPSPAARSDAATAFDSFADGSLVLVDSLALGAIADIVDRHASRLRLVALVHLPLAAEPGLPSGDIPRVAEVEGRAMRTARLVVVTGRAALPLLAAYDIESSRLVIVEPGTDRAPAARGSGGPAVHLVCVATVSLGKGHLDLVRALAELRLLDWQLTCAGSLTRDAEGSARVTDALARLELGDRVVFQGDLDRDALDPLYAESDVFVLATRRETYGMAVAEALAHGLPVVSTVTGAIPDLVGEAAGVLVRPGDVAALRDALARVIGDAALRSRLAEGARRAGERLPTWDESARRLAAALETVGHG